jgi:hypothetical protein
LHRVTLLSCDCPGFLRHQRCQHYALLLVQLGYLAQTEAVECLDCHGRGFTLSYVDGWAPPYHVPCDICDQTGMIDPLYLIDGNEASPRAAA